MDRINRRIFFRWIGAGAIGSIVKKSSEPSIKIQEMAQNENEVHKIQKYNHLGKTGLKVSDISFGAANYSNPNVVRYAYDLGVNYFDTSEVYMQSMSEVNMGLALKDIRHEVIIATKHAVSLTQAMKQNILTQRVEGSLKRLQTDYIDISLIHQVSDADVLENEEILATYDRLKKDGKIRFTGISTHYPEKMLKKLLETNFCDVVLFIYNHLEGPSAEPIIQKVRDKGIGTVAMKALAGNKQGNLKKLVNEQVKYSQAALRWVLSNPYIDTCVITMNTFSHVEEYTAASGRPLDKNSLKAISKYRNEARTLYCRVSCMECLRSCPMGVAINDVLRYAMYYEDYRMEKRAIELYKELDQGKKPVNCGDCPAPCINACPFGISVQERLLQAHRLLMV